MIVCNENFPQEGVQAHIYKGVSKELKTSVFSDEFESNENNWSNNNEGVEIVNGKLKIEASANNMKLLKAIDINENKDFEIETSIRFVSGSDKKAFGLIWGRNDESNKHFSLIYNNEGFVAINKYTGAYIPLVEPTNCKDLKSNENNKITIRKSDDLLYFFVNEQLLTNLPFKYFYGNMLGFSIPQGTTIEVDYLHITYFEKNKPNQPPEIHLYNNDEEGYIEVDGHQDSILLKGKITDDTKILHVKANREHIRLNLDGTFNIKVPYDENMKSIRILAMDEFLLKSELIVGISKNEEEPHSGNTLENEGKYYAFIIAVNDYKDPPIADLNAPAQDAKKLSNVLKEKYLFNESNMFYLENPSRRDIITRFDEISSTLNEEDNLLIFYAGHGYWDSNKDLGYWFPSDAEKTNSANWLRNSTIKDYIATINCRNILLIADACFSGSIFRTRSITIDADKKTIREYNLPARKAMTSGSLTEVPDKSIFLQYLIQRLQENTNKYLASKDLFDSFKEAVENNSWAKPLYGTIMNAGDQGGDFIFILKE